MFQTPRALLRKSVLLVSFFIFFATVLIVFLSVGSRRTSQWKSLGCVNSNSVDRGTIDNVLVQRTQLAPMMCFVTSIVNDSSDWEHCVNLNFFKCLLQMRIHVKLSGKLELVELKKHWLRWFWLLCHAGTMTARHHCELCRQKWLMFQFSTGMQEHDNAVPIRLLQSKKCTKDDTERQWRRLWLAMSMWEGQHSTLFFIFCIVEHLINKRTPWKSLSFCVETPHNCNMQAWRMQCRFCLTCQLHLEIRHIMIVWNQTHHDCSLALLQTLHILLCQLIPMVSQTDSCCCATWQSIVDSCSSSIISRTRLCVSSIFISWNAAVSHVLHLLLKGWWLLWQLPGGYCSTAAAGKPLTHARCPPCLSVVRVWTPHDQHWPIRIRRGFTGLRFSCARNIITGISRTITMYVQRASKG